MAAKKGKVTIVVPFTVEMENKADLTTELMDSVKDAIAEKVKAPARLKLEGVGKITFEEAVLK